MGRRGEGEGEGKGKTYVLKGLTPLGSLPTRPHVLLRTAPSAMSAQIV